VLAAELVDEGEGGFTLMKESLTEVAVYELAEVAHGFLFRRRGRGVAEWRAGRLGTKLMVEKIVFLEGEGKALGAPAEERGKLLEGE
jgi:hypothetical protein